MTKKTAPSEPSGTGLKPDPASAVTVDLDDRLVAEAARIYQAGLDQPLEDRQAIALGRAAPGGLEHKIVVWARGLAIAPAVVEAFAQLRTMLRLTTLVGLGLACGAGALTALTALEAPAGQAVNFHWALLSLLGLETLVLLLWVGLTLLRPGSVPGLSFGLLLSSLGRRLAGRLGGDSLHGATIRAAGTLTGRGAVARWSLSAISHGIWLAFLAGALAMTLLLLSAKHVSFVWQTTILSEASYLPATEALATLPRLAGFAVPTRDEIVASRWRGPEDLPSAASGAWSGLLVGSLVVYGLVPRGLLLGVCLLLWRRAAARRRLDLGRPEYQRLKDRLMPSVRHEGVIHRDREAADDLESALGSDDAPVPAIAFEGAVALIRLEIEAPTTGWPPDPATLDWQDLGAVDSREDRTRILAACTGPGLVLVAVSLLTTPDRGIGASLRELRAATPAPIAVLLSDGDRLRARLSAEDAGLRLADWRRVVVGAGIPAERAIRFDLAGPSIADRERLAALLGLRPR